jgi:hypothetical protein
LGSIALSVNGPPGIGMPADSLDPSKHSAAGRGDAPVQVGPVSSRPAGGHPGRIVGWMRKPGHAMLDDLRQTADARSSRWTITFWHTAGSRACAAAAGRAAVSPAVENIRDDGDLETGWS